jgi:hypothetical protein
LKAKGAPLVLEENIFMARVPEQAGDEVAGSFWQVVKAQKYTHGCDNARFEMVVFL